MQSQSISQSVRRHFDLYILASSDLHRIKSAVNTIAYQHFQRVRVTSVQQFTARERSADTRSYYTKSRTNAFCARLFVFLWLQYVLLETAFWLDVGPYRSDVNDKVSAFSTRLCGFCFIMYAYYSLRRFAERERFVEYYAFIQ